MCSIVTEDKYSVAHIVFTIETCTVKTSCKKCVECLEQCVPGFQFLWKQYVEWSTGYLLQKEQNHVQYVHTLGNIGGAHLGASPWKSLRQLSQQFIV